MKTASPEQIQRFPELSYHYGLSLAELIDMPWKLLRLYIEQLPGLLAQRQISLLEAGLISSYKEGEVERRITELQEIVDAHTSRPPEPDLTPELYELKLASLGVGITFVDEDADA